MDTNRPKTLALTATQSAGMHEQFPEQHQPTPWTLTYIESFPFGFQIRDAKGDIVCMANAVCHSSKQKTREDNINGVGFRGEGEWSRETAISLIAEQNATAELIVRSVNDAAALRAQRDQAVRALISAGYTLKSGAKEWKPPVGPSVSPLLDQIDSLRAQREELLATLNDMVFGSLIDSHGNRDENGLVTAFRHNDVRGLDRIMSVGQKAIAKCEVQS